METKNHAQEIPYQVRQAHGILCSVGARWLFEPTPQGLLCSVCGTLVPAHNGGIPLEQRALQEHSLCSKIYSITRTMGLRNARVPVSLQGGAWTCKICGESQQDGSLPVLTAFFAKHMKCLEAKEIRERLGIPTVVKYSKRRCEWVVRCQLCGGIISLAPEIAKRHKDCIQRHQQASKILAEISASMPQPEKSVTGPKAPQVPKTPGTTPRPELKAPKVPKATPPAPATRPEPNQSNSPQVEVSEVALGPQASPEEEVNINLRRVAPGIYTW
jgi:hypothetical protein